MAVLVWIMLLVGSALAVARTWSSRWPRFLRIFAGERLGLGAAPH